MPLEKHDVGRDIGERILAKGRFRQADSAKQVGLSRDMLTGRGIDGIHEIAADHKGRDAAFPQQADGLGKEVVVNREFPQFRKVRVIQGLVAEGGLPTTASKIVDLLLVFWKPLFICRAFG